MRRLVTAARRPGRRRGQSLTELAIMAPVIVLTLWMAIYLFEVILVRLKIQEACRFATWEMTAYPLHDYDDGPGSRFDDFRDEVETLTMDVYEDLDSSTRSAIPGGLADRNAFFATGWELERVRIRETTPPNLTGEIVGELGLSVVLTVAAWVESLLTSVTNRYAVGPVIWATRSLPSIDRRWGFNTRGYVRTTVQVRIYNRFVPTSYRDVTSLQFERDRWVRGSIRLREQAALVADSWRLNDGADVRHLDRDGGFYDQVERIYLLDRSRARLATTAISGMRTAIVGLTGQQTPDAGRPDVVSLAHRVDDDGRVTLQVDGGRAVFDSAPLTVEHPDPDHDGATWQPYQESLDNRGPNFMGCEESMNASCGAGLGTENPFGDGVHWPPTGR